MLDFELNFGYLMFLAFHLDYGTVIRFSKKYQQSEKPVSYRGMFEINIGSPSSLKGNYNALVYTLEVTKPLNQNHGNYVSFSNSRT
jgi:hypothetical protein